MDQSKEIIKGLGWKFLERFGVQFFSFLISVILARLLLPEDYGVIALTTFFISLASVFVTYGFGTALIQKSNADCIDFSTVFYLNLFVGVVLYCILFFIAPFIETFYGVSGLSAIVRVLSLTVIISALNNVQSAFLMKNMLFKSLFLASLAATLLSAALGIGLAYKGFGVWALVAQNLSYQIITTIVLWFSVKWRPTSGFSFSRLKTLFSFGWKVMLVGFMDTVYNEITGLLIGKFYSTEDLAYYSKGQQFPKLIIVNINSTIDSVIFPVLARVQNDIAKVKEITKKFVVYSYFFVAPIALGLLVVAKPLVLLLLTDKWIMAVPYLQIACLLYLLLPINTANLQSLKSIGRSDVLLYLNIVKIVFGLLFLIIFVRFNVFYLAISIVVSMLFSVAINSIVNRKFINYGLLEQFADILPSLIISILMAVITYFSGFVFSNQILSLLFQIFAGAASYFLLSFLLKTKAFSGIVHLAKNMKKGS